MAIRNDDSVKMSLQGLEKFTTREELRAFIMTQWIKENPETKYRYFVETYDNGLSIYLERPGRLNKGCDFVIYAENAYIYNNGNDRPPDHVFVLEDLREKKRTLSSKDWENVLFAIKQIYDIQPYKNIVSILNNLPQAGKSYELIIKIIKWFFIEQDITYWFGQGRSMFYNAIMEL